jgi:hypothetical protein
MKGAQRATPHDKDNNPIVIMIILIYQYSKTSIPKKSSMEADPVALRGKQ